MLKWFIGSVTALILGSLLNYAGAASPVWELNVVYSNADGTVQFVVHSAPRVRPPRYCWPLSGVECTTN